MIPDKLFEALQHLENAQMALREIETPITQEGAFSEPAAFAAIDLIEQAAGKVVDLAPADDRRAALLDTFTWGLLDDDAERAR